MLKQTADCNKTCSPTLSMTPAALQVQSATSSVLKALPPEVSDALRSAGAAVQPLTGRAAQGIQSDARLSAAALA